MQYVTKLQRRFNLVTAKLTQSPATIASGVVALHVGIWLLVTLLLIGFTAEDSFYDAFSAGAIVASTVSSGNAVIASFAAVALISERSRMDDLDAIRFAVNLTRLYSVAAPVIGCVVVSLILASAHWIGLSLALVGLASECAVYMRYSHMRRFDATTLYKTLKPARMHAIASGVIASALVVYCASHLTGLILRAMLGIIFRTARQLTNKSEGESFFNIFRLSKDAQ